MNIVLLSGGSGKRLWPLSNDIRSKQFLKLFKNNKNEYESMVQRVYRQIKDNIPYKTVTIATGSQQASLIKNQLGDFVDVCVEPCRRDTFPAIALACSYLKDILNVSMDECVVVCPVDPYVDDEYFRTIAKLENYVKQGDSNIYLMGIEPTYPSDKYGYIIPKNGNDVSLVKSFKEKPSVEVAQKYLKENALWNAGVFAFKLNYILKKAHELIDFIDYNDLYNKYDSLKKISFDYAVVEKEENISVVRYNGQWKDIGTWNTLTEVIQEKTKGKVLLGKDCNNSKIINELNIPIVCMGISDMIVASSLDGILITTKNLSGDIKPIVETLGEDSRIIEKNWGTYNVIDIEPDSKTIKIFVKKDCSVTFNSQENINKTWTIVAGKGEVVIDCKKFNVASGDVITIKPKSTHSIKALTELDLIEVQIIEN